MRQAKVIFWIVGVGFAITLLLNVALIIAAAMA